MLWRYQETKKAGFSINQDKIFRSKAMVLKSEIFSRFLMIVSISCCMASQIEAQKDYSRIYRVTAYNKLDDKVTSLSNVAVAYPKPLVYIPNTFTPNGDGLNDFFKVEGVGIGDFNLEIFNRWGELVFETSDINKSWDGYYKGERIKNTDVFVYKMISQGMYSKEYIQKEGKVILLAEGTDE